MTGASPPTSAAGTEELLGDVVDKPREDCRLLHPLCANTPTTRAGRVKALLTLPTDACFSTAYVHTFELSIASGVKMDTWEVRPSAGPVPNDQRAPREAIRRLRQRKSRRNRNARRFARTRRR